MASSKFIIIESVAMCHWFDDYYKTPSDVDLLSMSENTDINIDAKWHPLAEKLIDLSKNKTFLDPDLLYTLKVSHAPWDIHWDKTMKDIHFLKSKGCVLNEELRQELFDMWKVIHVNKHDKSKINLSVKNDDFFTENVVRKYDHDMLHEMLAYNSRPMHEKIRKDMSSPKVDKSMFDMLSFEQKLQLASEETMVIAVERFGSDIEKGMIVTAYAKAYKKLVTTMTTGFFNTFMICHQKEIMTFHGYKEKLSKFINN